MTFIAGLKRLRLRRDQARHELAALGELGPRPRPDLAAEAARLHAELASIAAEKVRLYRSGRATGQLPVTFAADMIPAAWSEAAEHRRRAAEYQRHAQTRTAGPVTQLPSITGPASNSVESNGGEEQMADPNCTWCSGTGKWQGSDCIQCERVSDTGRAPDPDSD